MGLGHFRNVMRRGRTTPNEVRPQKILVAKSDTPDDSAKHEASGEALQVEERHYAWHIVQMLKYRAYQWKM